MKNIILFASGGGSNVKAILQYFADQPTCSFPLVVTNNAKAGVIEVARSFGVDVAIITREIFEEPVFLDTLDFFKPDLLVLAGFLWKLPEYLVKNYPNQIINIHPSLLPSFGGKGMYGHHVHEAVIQARAQKSGITIHMVNEEYDKGRILLQKEVEVLPDDSPESLAAKVLKLEHHWFSRVIESLIKV